MIRYVVTFAAGWLTCWKLSGWLLRRVFGKGFMLVSTLKNLGPDSFAMTKKAVDDEAVRRATLDGH